MLTFKKKFLDAIREGRKTQTLRFWKSPIVHANRKSFIPGVGLIWIDSVELVTFEELTDADAIPDGFPNLESLKQEITAIYGEKPAGNLYRVRFHVMPKEVPAPSETFLQPSDSGTAATNSSSSCTSSHSEKTNSSSSSFGKKSRETAPAKSDETEKIKTAPLSESKGLPATETPGKDSRVPRSILHFVHGLKERLENEISQLCKSSKDGPANAADLNPQANSFQPQERRNKMSENQAEKMPKAPVEKPVSKAVSDETAKEIPVEQRNDSAVKEIQFLTEEEVAAKMIRRCRINRNVCDWNHEPCKSQDFFAIFLQAPRNEKGIPKLDGYRLRSLMRSQIPEEEWEEICWIASEVCAAWTEWQYAVEHWK